MTIYQVTAWCIVPHYTVFDVEASTIDDALAKARIQVRDQYGDSCVDGEWDWDEFEICAEDDATEFLAYLAPDALVRNAAPELLQKLRRGVSLARNIVDCWERGDLAAAVRALSEWSPEASGVICKATDE